MIFPARFLNISESCPDNIAVETNGEDFVTYADLKNRAFSIATYLKEHGVQNGNLVALSIEKSSDYIAALLGCWFAGAAFMPLDPCMPPERRNFILEDAKPHFILNKEDIPSVKPAPFSPVSYDSDMLAYVIYTSGSTGQPKGVMVPHRGILNCLETQIKEFAVKPESRSLFYLSVNFDASLSDIGTALLSGATLVIESGSALENAEKLAEIIRDRTITHMDIPPSLLRLLKTEDMPDSLETVIIGGEACPIETVRQWAEHVRLVNVYGPTEATIWYIVIPRYGTSRSSARRCRALITICLILT